MTDQKMKVVAAEQRGEAAVLADIRDRIEQLDSKVSQLLAQRAIKDFYSTAEVAQLVGKAEFTVREWCRLGRIRAQKRATGRGPVQEWMVSHEELVRYQNHGLLPTPHGPLR